MQGLPNVDKRRFVASTPKAYVHFRSPYAAVVKIGRMSSWCELNAAKTRRWYLAQATINNCQVDDRILAMSGLQHRFVGKFFQRNSVWRQPSNDEVIGYASLVHCSCNMHIKNKHASDICMFIRHPNSHFVQHYVRSHQFC